LLAAYFCLIDLVLTGQYIYYSRPRPRSTPDDTPSEPDDHLASSTTDVRTSSSRPLTLPRSRSDQRLLQSPSESLTEAALEVALAAERVERSRSRRRYGSESRSRGPGTTTTTVSADRSSKLLRDGHLAERPADQAGPYSSSSTREQSQASSPRATIKGKGALGLSTSPTVKFGQDDRGRHEAVPSGETSGMGERRSSRPRSSSRMRSSGDKPARHPGQTAAGVVFMGVWALAGLNWRTGGRSAGRDVGAVNREGAVISPRWTGQVGDQAGLSGTTGSTGNDILELYFASPSTLTTTTTTEDDDHPTHRRWDKAAVQRLIGRMSAWICTTLYLTSRLPQIWKNVSAASRIMSFHAFRPRS